MVRGGDYSSREMRFLVEVPMQGAQTVLSSHSLSCTLMCQELLSLLMAAPSLVWFGATVYPAHLAPWSEF